MGPQVVACRDVDDLDRAAGAGYCRLDWGL